MPLMSEEWVGMVKDSETGLIKQNAKINLWDQLYMLASVDKGIHNKTTKYGLPTY